MSQAHYQFLKYQLDAGLITITIDRPPYNVLDIALMEELNHALDQAAKEESAKVLMITSAGEKVFSAGVDVMDHTPDKVVQMIDVFHGILKRLMVFPLPTVAALNGSAMGGGCELAIACDMVVAAEGTKIGQPEIKLGVFPPIAAILMPKIVSLPKVMELLLGGGLIDAAEAERLGMVNRVVPRESFRADARAFVEQFLSLSRVALIYTKRAIREASGKPFFEALFTVEQIYLKELMATADAVEGLNAFMEKRKPVWTDR
ncbi:MAG: enoyl-CoA hydratase/isomerase family protein [Rhodocyclaceae bacterium]|jgi:cyclohexa-1,5-dienecarbonyl-CoA hydratase|nr:enoyl-CoA hydratase/isomerase family protein [Rhodocyclaceae bacterium]MCL4759615.1 enoyl-CoA hydratase/isomerase family protein [Rhodocyclaceae bacterium]